MPEREALPDTQWREFLGALRRRKRWVILSGLLGVLAGIAGALWLPRRFVAQTEVEFRLVRFEEDPTYRNPRETPVQQAFANIDAHLRAGDRVERVVAEDLGWPEFAAVSRTPAAKQAYLAGIQKRIGVQVLPKLREPAGDIVRITFSDEDPMRAADFCNAISARWRGELLQGFRDEVTREIQSLREKVAERTREFDQAQEELQRWKREFKISPAGVGPEGEDWVFERVLRLQDERDRLARELRATTEMRGQAEKALADIPTMITEAPTPTAPDLARRAKAAELRLEKSMLVTKQGGIKPSHSSYERLQKRIDDLGAQIRELESALEATLPPPREVAHPAWQLQSRRVAELREKETELESLLSDVQSQLERQGEQLPERYTAVTQLRAYANYADQKTEALNSTVADLRRKQDLLQHLSSKEADPFVVLQEAYPPSRATEPDPIAVFGVCLVLGVAAGVGLVALREYGRTAYRSVEDASRSLPVPVLGAVAWILTEVERRRGRRRRLTTVGAVTAVAGLVAAVFYLRAFRPQILPPGLLQVLEALGGGSSR